MGAGQIGGIATLLDIDFENAAGFLGRNAAPSQGQYVVSSGWYARRRMTFAFSGLLLTTREIQFHQIYYFSQALMFCAGVLIEPHIVLTPAMCVFGERNKFEVYGGSHSFLENAGVSRMVHHLSIHRGYNHTRLDVECITDNVAILVLSKQYSFNTREPNSEYIMNRVRYGVTDNQPAKDSRKTINCYFYGWGSRRNGYLIPLLIHKKRMEVLLHPKEVCPSIWNRDNKFLCIEQPPCKSADFGALCPDDVGTVLVCSGFARGMMISRLVDRPCGVGFVDLTLYNKFLTCGVDDSRDVIMHDEYMAFEFTTLRSSATPSVIVPHIKVDNGNNNDNDKNDNNNKNDNVNNNTDESFFK